MKNGSINLFTIRHAVGTTHHVLSGGHKSAVSSLVLGEREDLLYSGSWDGALVVSRQTSPFFVRLVTNRLSFLRPTGMGPQHRKANPDLPYPIVPDLFDIVTTTSLRNQLHSFLVFRLQHFHSRPHPAKHHLLRRPSRRDVRAHLPSVPHQRQPRTQRKPRSRTYSKSISPSFRYGRGRRRR